MLRPSNQGQLPLKSLLVAHRTITGRAGHPTQATWGGTGVSQDTEGEKETKNFTMASSEGTDKGGKAGLSFAGLNHFRMFWGHRDYPKWFSTQTLGDKMKGVGFR